MKLTILLCLSLLSTISTHAKGPVNKEVVVPESPIAELKVKNKMNYFVIAQSAAMDQCDHLDQAHRADCQRLQDYYVRLNASNGKCQSMDKALAKKCSTVIQDTKLKVTEASSVQGSMANDKIKKLFLEHCSEGNANNIKKCEEDLAATEESILYQENCYRCMDKKFLQQCLRLDLYNVDNYLKRKLQLSAFLDECGKVEDVKHKSVCNFFHDTMLEVESQGKTCSNFITPSMIKACENWTKSAEVNDSRLDEKSRENQKDETIRVLRHETTKQ